MSRPPKHPPSSREGRLAPEDTPLPMWPLAYLDYTDAEPTLRTRLAWSDLSREADLQARWNAHISDVTEADGALLARMPLRTPSPDPARPAEVGSFGVELRIRIRPHPEHGGLRLVDRIEMVDTAADQVLSIRTFGYQAVRLGKTDKTAPLLANLRHLGPDGTSEVLAFETTLLEVGLPIPASSFAIDPTMARTVWDADTRMTIEPEGLDAPLPPKRGP